MQPLPDFNLVLVIWTSGSILQTAALVSGVAKVCVTVRNHFASIPSEVVLFRVAFLNMTTVWHGFVFLQYVKLCNCKSMYKNKQYWWRLGFSREFQQGVHGERHSTNFNLNSCPQPTAFKSFGHVTKCLPLLLVHLGRIWVPGSLRKCWRWFSFCSARSRRAESHPVSPPARSLLPAGQQGLWALI